MVLDHHYKYVHYQDGTSELYDQESDPQEITNLAGDPDHRDIEIEARTHLLEHRFSHDTYRSRTIQRTPNPYRDKAFKESKAP